MYGNLIYQCVLYLCILITLLIERQTPGAANVSVGPTASHWLESHSN
jgi:hypothetical protein